MNHGSLFSGIGGFDLAAEWMGWNNIFHCEINPFGRKILNHYWPNAISHDDITKTDFTIYRGSVDILTGGFPCQPYSLAGKRKGKDDERHLWPQMLRAITEIHPRWIVGENVFGLINWSGGLVFHEVQTDLEAAGYEVWPYVLPACAVNAPHRRDRVWFIAKNTNGDGWGSDEREKQPEKRGFGNISPGDNEWIYTNDAEIGITADTKSWGDGRLRNEIETARASKSNIAFGSVCGVLHAPNANDQRLERETANGNMERTQRFGIGSEQMGGQWESFPTQPPVCSGNDGVPSQLDGITFSKWRNESIKAAGNAIVPQVAMQIFKAINQMEHESNNHN